MNIREKITELELEIERLKSLESLELSNKDMKITKFFVENNTQIKYLNIENYHDYYMLNFVDKDKKLIVSVDVEDRCQTVYENDFTYYDVEFILED